MKSPAVIEVSGVIIAFIPVLLVIAVLYIWSLQPTKSIYASARMLLQLLVIGYFLQYIFTATSWLIALVFAVMIAVSGWIALGVVPDKRKKLYFTAFIAIGIGGGTVLLLMVYGVLHTNLLTNPQISIPLAGMIFANSMNAISLASERFYAEATKQYAERRNAALNTALIPITNSMMAVGLVSIPGMMTGQILSGVSPFIAARYQIMVMCMVFGASGIATIIFLWLLRKERYSVD